MTQDLAKIARELSRLAEAGLEDAAKLGIAETKFTTACQRDVRLVIEAGDFTLANSAYSQSLGIAVHHEQKKGSASINRCDAAELHQAMMDAKALASFSLPDEYLNLPDKSLAPAATPLPFLYDAALSDITLSDLKPVMKEAFKILTSDKRVALDRFELECETTHLGLYNSRGVKQDEAQTMVSWSYLAAAVDNDDVGGMDYDGGFSFDRATFAEKLLKDATAFRDRILANLRPIPGPSYQGLVILSPRALDELVIEPILYHLSGWQIMDGKSRWDKHLGQQVAASGLTILDMPHNPELMGATSYDDDGLPTREMVLMENGVIRSFLFDCYSARKTGQKTNASAGGPFNVILAPGHEDMKTITSMQPTMLLADRFSGNVDPLTGDFSGVVKSSHLYKNGIDQGVVTETMIAGNVFDMLKRIVAVSNTRENVGGTLLAPHLVVDGISVSGEG